MKKNSQNNILVAFILNFTFTIIEIVGGILTNSVAILSDAVHDFGDSLSIGVSFLLEKKSNKKQNEKYTFGYIRLRTISALFTSLVLIVGSVIIVYESIQRLINPESIKTMWIFIISIFGIIFNGLAVLKTSKSENINEKSINLHILEDVLGWVVVFVGSIFMWAFNITWLDSVMSILVTIFILYHTIKNLIEVFNIFMESAPHKVEVAKLKEHILKNENIKDLHHVHIWTLDGQVMIATCHVVLNNLAENKDLMTIKQFVKDEAKEFGINEIVVEIEFYNDDCKDEVCDLSDQSTALNNGHHHHH